MSFWLFLLAPITLLLAYTSTPVTENDPSTLVDGVSVITGDFYLGEEDYLVAGAEPIPVRRYYLSAIGGIPQYPHLTASFALGMNKLIIHEPNGTQVIYAADPSNKPRGQIGEEFYAKKKHPLRYHSIDFANTSPGVTNTSTGSISAKSQLKNQTIIFDPRIDPKGKSFTLYTSDGTQRRYTSYSSQEKTNLGPHGKAYTAYYYKLASETLPNGRILHYEWDHENTLIGMRTTNPQGTKTFAKLPFPKLNPNNLQSSSIHGSDGRSASYIYRQIGKKRYEFAQVVSPEQADQYFEYSLDRLSQISLPGGRTIQIQYQGAKVAKLLAPIGHNEALIPYYIFNHNEQAKTCICIDALDNQTTYFWNKDYRLTRIEHFEGRSIKKSSETFVWEGTNLRSKVFYDETDTPLFAKTLAYDAKGNVLEETLWGNLSGKSLPLHIDSSGSPLVDTAETAITKNTYDSRNLLIKKEEPNGLITEYTYLPHAQLPSSQTLTANGKTLSKTTYAYDSDNTLIREVAEEGKSVHKIQEIIPRRIEPYIGLPDWIIEKYAENGTPKLLKKTKLHYTNGALISQKDLYDSHGNFHCSLYYQYDAKGRLLEETNALGQKAIYRYDEIGNKIYTKDFSQRTETTYDYDASNRLTKKTLKGFDGIQQEFHYTYDLKHNLTTATDAYGNTTQYQYDPFGNTTKTTLPLQQTFNVPARSALTQIHYDSMGNPILQIDAEGNETKTTFNILGKPTNITYPDGATEENTYNLDGTLSLHTDPIGIETHYKYDAFGHIIEKKTNDDVQTFIYDGNHLIESIDAEGTKTHYRYDGAGRKIAEETAGECIEFTYDHWGRIASRIEADLTISYQYDLLGRTLEEKKTNNAKTLLQITHFEYDSAGNQTAITQGNLSTEHFEYDSLNRLIRKTDPLGNIETTQYEVIPNKLGQKVLQKTTTDPLGLQTIETFDAQHRTISLEKRKEKTLLLENIYYNLNGQKTAQEEHLYHPDNAQRHILNEWEYDTRDRLITLIEGNHSKITRYTYNPRGEKIAVIKPDATILHYQYNSLGHLIHLYSSDKSVDHRLNLDKRGRLIDFDGINRTLDAHGRILSEKLPSGPISTSRYDSRGRKTQHTIPCFDLKIEYQHGPLDMETVTFQNHTHAYTNYDLAGNLLQEKLIGHSGTLTRTYDQAQRPLSLQSPHFSQTVQEYDPIGNILSMDTNSHHHAYTYDNLYQLTSETGPFCHNYTFDPLYNRLSKDTEQYNLNPLNQAISHCTYDLNGNPTQIGEIKLTYDALDRLIHIETPTATQSYTYDYLNRRLTQTTDNTTTLYFLYDDQNEIGSFDQTLRDFRVLGRTETAEINAAVAILIDQELYTPIHDLQGNIATLIPHTQSPPIHYLYSAFGEEPLNAPPISPWRFSSKRTDALTGFVNYGRRYYIPTLGRWLTPDPLGFTAGANLYAFVKNCPLTHLDEYGLYSIPISYKPWQESSEGTKRFSTAAAHEVGSQTLDVGRFFASSPYQVERGFNYLTGRQTYAFASWHEKQSQFFNKAEDWMYRAIPADRTHPDYLMYRRGIGAGIEIGTLATGGYGLVKGTMRAARWGTSAWKVRKGTFIAAEKLALTPKLSLNIPSVERKGISLAGSRRSPLEYAPFQLVRNETTVINNKTYVGHALDRMQDRGFMPSVIENALKTGKASQTKIPGRVQYYDPANNLRVIIQDNERIISIIPKRSTK